MLKFDERVRENGKYVTWPLDLPSSLQLPPHAETLQYN